MNNTINSFLRKTIPLNIENKNNIEVNLATFSSLSENNIIPIMKRYRLSNDKRVLDVLFANRYTRAIKLCIKETDYTEDIKRPLLMKSVEYDNITILKLLMSKPNHFKFDKSFILDVAIANKSTNCFNHLISYTNKDEINNYKLKYMVTKSFLLGAYKELEMLFKFNEISKELIKPIIEDISNEKILSTFLYLDLKIDLSFTYDIVYNRSINDSNIKTLEYLQSKGYDIYKNNQILLSAIKNKNIVLINKILTEKKDMIKNNEVLFHAIRYENYNITENLINDGYDIDIHMDTIGDILIETANQDMLRYIVNNSNNPTLLKNKVSYVVGMSPYPELIEKIYPAYTLDKYKIRLLLSSIKYDNKSNIDYLLSNTIYDKYTIEKIILSYADFSKTENNKEYIIEKLNSHIKKQDVQ